MHCAETAVEPAPYDVDRGAGDGRRRARSELHGVIAPELKDDAEVMGRRRIGRTLRGPHAQAVHPWEPHRLPGSQRRAISTDGRPQGAARGQDLRRSARARAAQKPRAAEDSGRCRRPGAVGADVERRSLAGLPRGPAAVGPARACDADAAARSARRRRRGRGRVGGSRRPSSAAARGVGRASEEAAAVKHASRRSPGRSRGRRAQAARVAPLLADPRATAAAARRGVRVGRAQRAAAATSTGRQSRRR